MKNLMSMTDFVLEQDLNTPIGRKASEMIRYGLFLKQPLELCMFVPCDKDGYVLEEPKRWNDYLNAPESFDGNIEWYDFYIYEKAKEKVLFYSQHGDKELFDVSLAKVYLDEFFNIEQLANEIGRIKLTQTAIKQLGL